MKSNSDMTLHFKDNGKGVSKKTNTSKIPDNKMGFQIIDTLVKAQLNGTWEYTEKPGMEHIIKFKLI